MQNNSASAVLTEIFEKHPSLAKASEVIDKAQTLSALGYSSSKEAKQQNAVCVRSASQKGRQSLPGLWLSPTAAQELLPLMQERRAQAWERQAIEAEMASQRAAQKEQARTLAQAQKELRITEALLAEIADMPSDAVALDEAQQLEERVAAAVKALPAKLKERLMGALGHEQNLSCQVVLHRAWKWQGQVLTTQGVYLSDAGSLSPALSRACLLAALEDAHEHYERAVGQLHAASEGKAQVQAQKWADSGPLWLEPQDVRNWMASRAVALDVDHPSTSQAVSLSRFVLKSEGFGANGGFKVTVEGVSLTSKVTPEELAQACWHNAAVSRESLGAFAHKWLHDQTLSAVQELEQALLAATPFGSDDSQGWTAEQWHELARKVALLAVQELGWRPAPKDLQERWSAHLALRKSQIASSKVAQELPATYPEFFPLARSLGRRITFISGPTNSGKTYEALNLLTSAANGVYLGPLRLLALEVYDSLKERGVDVSLVTGELQIKSETATHTAATVEMLALGQQVEVAVIDEIQMIDDPDRGAAWVQAVLGAPARHVVLVGAPSALPRIQEIAQMLGEPLRVIEKTRLSQLSVMDAPTPKKQAPDGTAFIVFSRKEALNLSTELRERLKQPVSVIYGALSPEVRREQARMFREGETKLLVATDAIGLGLNLPIRRVVFTTSVKWNGTAEVPLDPMMIRQIAGRAGRYGKSDAGEVSALDARTLNDVRKGLAAEVPTSNAKLGVSLSAQVAELIGRHLNTDSLSEILAFFAAHLVLGDAFTPQVTQDQAAMARLLDSTPLELTDKVRLLNAPAWNKNAPDREFIIWAHAIANGRKARLPRFPNSGLEGLEGQVRTTTLYCWLHYRYPHVATELEEAQKQLAVLNSRINEVLNDA